MTPGVAARTLRIMYRVAWGYLACFAAFQVAYALLGPYDQAALTAWASTDVANLTRDPVGCLVVSAFVTGGNGLAWVALIALALFGANRALGNRWTAVVCATGHVAGTLVSEGIIAYRTGVGQLPGSDRYITDVGPSYVVVSAIVIALMCGSWRARVAAALDLAILVFAGQIFAGLSRLDVAAVGHLTAIVTAAACTAALLVRRRRRPGQETWPTPRPIA